MDVAMMQPTFAPWQGYFELIYRSEIFILLDDFQFSVQSYQQRNRLFVNKEKIGWYTVPVQKTSSFMAPLNEVRINEATKWRVKMWKAIELNYSKAPFFKDMLKPLKEWIFGDFSSLAEMNISFIKMVCGLLDLKREFRLSSDFPVSSKRSKRVLELLHWCGAKRYFSAKGAFEYMLEDGVFPVADIEVIFQSFTPKEYKQIGSLHSFIPYLSIADALMNVGPKETLELIKGGTSKWLIWEDMKRRLVLNNQPS
ncbi:MAG: WbqC family protein [Candidatus Omnitrophica bacterium]|nr:WbqC family protein [Candidatus Omnitrophota bacterium]